ncbi:MAG: bifunctional diguanylate cyclase/phosphodiesterase [Eubacterium sp.]|nr:bifunctional diguanylate cyclase/phosphodiesterase [Eubacterium sp.]MCM1213081.1 bifunctional diguanylate cyclase/phosphodiesterase [Lachnospiraceae bacterium]MCM1239388.1 bifunctional diguanylate cyclase/phosphodiesterase [Lachnospiraceae bacterium]
MRYNIHYDIAAIVLTAVILIHYYHRKAIMQPQSHVFTRLMWLSLFTDVLDIVTVVIDEYKLSALTVNAVNVVYLILFNMAPYLYYMYLLTLEKRRELWARKDRLILYVPVTCVVALICTSPLTKLIFYYDPAEGYCHGKGFFLLYISAVIYMAETVAVTLRYREQMTVWQRSSVYMYLLASAAGILVQIFIPHVLMLQFATSLSLLVLYMSLENPDEDEDKLLGVYNRRGFEKVVGAAVEAEERFQLLVVTVRNFQLVRETAGVSFCQVMMKQAMEHLKDAVKPCLLFSISEGRFAVMVDGRRKAEEIIDVLQQEFAQPIVSGGMNIQVRISILQIGYPGEVSTIEDVMDSIDHAEVFRAEGADDRVLHGSGEVLNAMRRENRILQAMQQALDNGTFQVFYQPIYSAEEKRYNSAEALIRLIDDELGFISPEEFIPMAEKNGMILQIGEFVFRTVCEMMARERIWEKGIDYIEVNLSVVQCMQEDICEMLYGIMDEYDIPYSCINLEVTETVIARDILWNIMERMTVGGVTFSLDDYGTGYSNLTNVLKYPFHIVKLDKSMVWYAMENERAMCALRYTVSMMQELDKHIVAEGVETREQRDILEELGCHYLQGYYFSKPVPEQDFLQKLA